MNDFSQVDKMASLANEPITQLPNQELPSYIEPKADCIYGATDSGKTTNIGLASDYVLNKYGKLSRLITADGGGIGPLAGLADSRQMEVWTISAWKDSIAMMKKACFGWWPMRLDDPEAPLIKPDAGLGEIYGLIAFEGLTSWGDRILQSLEDDRASLSQDPSYVFVQGGEKFAGGNMSYYGFIQERLKEWVYASHLLPVEKVLWTALESKGAEDGIPVYGPAIAGKKSISKAPNWFSNCLHIDIVMKPSKIIEVNGVKLEVTETERIMWLRTHADSLTKTNYPCKVRVPVQYASEVPSYMVPPDLGKIYRMIDDLQERQLVESRNKMGSVEAVRDRLMKAAKVANERQEKLAMEKAKRATVNVPSGMPMAMPVVAKPAMPVPTIANVAPVNQPTSVVTMPVGIAIPGAVTTIQTVRKK